MGPVIMRDIKFWVFVIGAFAVRIPLLFALDLHSDEQTFLNIGHDVALGHLPYLHTWDHNPPLLYFIVAPITIIAHHQIWIVRLFAAAFDILTALFVKRIADRLFGEASGNWLAAIWWFAAITVRDGSGTLMSDTVALPFLMGGALLLCRERPVLWQGFLAGVSLGAATLVRASPVFAAVAVVVVIFSEGLVRRDWHLARVGAFVIFGGLCTLISAILPYVIVGEMDMLVRSMLLSPIGYVQERGQSSIIDTLATIASSRSIGGAFLFGVPGLISCAAAGPRSAGALRVGVMWAAQLVGVSQGPPGAFYLITLVPFACVFAAPVFSRLLAIPRSGFLKAALIAFLMLPVPIAAAVAIKRGGERSPMADTLAILSEEMGPGDTLYLATDYLLYWLLERAPPHPIVTHAGSLFKPGMFRVLPFGMNTSADVMRAIVAARPTWIVFDTDYMKLYEEGEVGQVLQPVLASQYELTPSPARRAIYHLRGMTTTK
jgi:4-amino-4-deoxy-L-arabinose transferase-like glycosyltransferase